MKIKIESDGTHLGTKVLTEDGTPIENVVRVGWYAGVDHEVRAYIELFQVQVNVIGELNEDKHNQ